jgi:uncharacterized protein YgbK (DUF1537 family)
MTSSLKSSLDPATTGPTIGLVLNECLRRRVMSPHEEIEAALDEYQTRSCAATVTGAQAFARLLRLAEERDSGQIVHVARFLAATYNGQAFPLDLFELAPERLIRHR